MLVTMKPILEAAKKGGYCVAAPNFFDYGMLLKAIEAAEERRAAVRGIGAVGEELVLFCCRRLAVFINGVHRIVARYITTYFLSDVISCARANGGVGEVGVGPGKPVEICIAHQPVQVVRHGEARGHRDNGCKKHLYRLHCICPFNR